VKITFVLPGGQEKTIEANVGDTILDVIEENDIPVFGGCSGAGICGSCRVKIENADGKIEPAEDQELNVTGAFHLAEDVRLACQVTLTQSSDGLRVVLI
jgi:ferredoxin